MRPRSASYIYSSTGSNSVSAVSRKWYSMFLMFLEILDTSKFSVPHRSSIEVERFEFEFLRAFQMEWFEVAIWPRRTSEKVPEFLAPDQAIQSFPAGSPSRRRNRARSARRGSRRLHSDGGLYT